MENRPPKLGIIAGGGLLPRILIDELKSSRDIFVIALEGECLDETIKDTAHEWVNLAAAGKTIKLLKSNNIGQVVLAGSIKRPALSSLRPDFEGIKLLGTVMKLQNQGDNAILVAIINHLEGLGFEVVGTHQLLESLLIKEGPLSKITPGKRDLDDIEIGAKTLRSIGVIDIGQAVIVQSGRVIGIEAVEGTDQLIKRCAPYLKEDKGGVLVKMRKSGQDRRADLPTIGLATAENIAAAGLAGIAIESGSSLVIEKGKLIETANKLGIFILGIQ